ncbi:hypothetical protein BJ165DRAFT_137958 [Panaeolus papilionaceus]|nr:hypothetical protein BJ165DRAFT_137958 [Panaeolus papilionaceus]
MDNQYAHLLHSSSEESLVLESSRLEKSGAGDGRQKTCAALSIIIIYHEFYNVSPSASTNKPLRRPSTYVNLDRVLAGSNHTFDPIINFPQTIYQIKTDDPKRRMTEDHRSWRAEIGTVYPDDRHIHITPEV